MKKMLHLKIIFTLFAMLFLFSSANTNTEKTILIKPVIEISELKQDSIEMKLNRALIDESKSYQQALESKEEIKEQFIK